MPVESTAAQDVRKAFREAGFEVADLSQDAQSFEVRKDNCVQLIQQLADGKWMPSGPPVFFMRGLKCKLEDRGYQKFWNHEGKRFPVRVNDLRTLHRFDQEVRSLLGLKSLYHESLGTTSERSAYDRLEGRPDR